MLLRLFHGDLTADLRVESLVNDVAYLTLIYTKLSEYMTFTICRRNILLPSVVSGNIIPADVVASTGS